MRESSSRILKVRTPKVSPLFRSTILVGLICLAALLMVGGVVICYTLKGNEQFMVGVVVVGLGVLLLSCIKDFVNGVGT